MSKYQKGKIYKLVSNYTDEIYIGSTIQPLNKRISQHRENRNCCESKKLTELGEIKIILIENFPCESKEELLKRERFYIESMDCLNKRCPIITETERKESHYKNYLIYQKLNSEKIKEHKRFYSLKNKEKINEKKKIKYNCDCGSSLRVNEKARHEKTKKHITYINSLN